MTGVIEKANDVAVVAAAVETRAVETRVEEEETKRATAAAGVWKLLAARVRVDRPPLLHFQRWWWPLWPLLLVRTPHFDRGRHSACLILPPVACVWASATKRAARAACGRAEGTRGAMRASSLQQAVREEG